jgi:hypothetical protein
MPNTEPRRYRASRKEVSTATTIVIGVLSTGAVSPVTAATLVFDAAVPSLVKQPVTVDYEFAGLVGDPISVPDGSHSIRIKGEHQQRLSIDLTVQGASVSVKAVGVGDDGCIVGPVWSVVGWTPSVGSALDSNGFVHITLPDPPYKQTGSSSSCLPSSMSGIPPSLAVLVRSTPTGSEIYVDGVLAGQSDTTISIPYYTTVRPKSLVVRHDAYFPCKREVRLTPPQTQSVTCKLQLVPPPH